MQVAGRAQRSPDKTGLYVIFYEPWAEEIELNEYSSTKSNDPDRPRMDLTSSSSKQQRAGYTPVLLVKSEDCARHAYANYLEDDDPSGELSSIILNQANVFLISTYFHWSLVL